jgi:hypothetical protein
MQTHELTQRHAHTHTLSLLHIIELQTPTLAQTYTVTCTGKNTQMHTQTHTLSRTHYTA